MIERYFQLSNFRDLPCFNVVLMLLGVNLSIQVLFPRRIHQQVIFKLRYISCMFFSWILGWQSRVKGEMVLILAVHNKKVMINLNIQPEKYFYFALYQIIQQMLKNQKKYKDQKGYDMQKTISKNHLQYRQCVQYKLLLCIEVQQLSFQPKTQQILFQLSIRVLQIIRNYRMWLLNWFKSTLQSLGLANKKAKIVFLGLDDAGKTTLLLRLKEDVMKQMDPTQQPYSEELTMGKITFKAWDLGGHEAARKTWRNYVSDVDGIIYLVDSSNSKRFEQSRIELQGILQMPELQKVPIIILGNKIDKAGAVPENELRESLGIEPKNEWNKDSNRPIEIFMCSVAKKKGYAQGFKWLSTFLK